MGELNGFEDDVERLTIMQYSKTKNIYHDRGDYSRENTRLELLRINEKNLLK